MTIEKMKEVLADYLLLYTEYRWKAEELQKENDQLRAQIESSKTVKKAPKGR